MRGLQRDRAGETRRAEADRSDAADPRLLIQAQARRGEGRYPLPPVPPYVPLSVGAFYPPPAGSISPDRSKSALRRSVPVVLAHRGTFFTALAFSAIALVFQIAAPRILMAGIDRAILAHSGSLTPYVIVLLGLAALQLVASYVSRLNLQRTGFAIEYDLRTMVYEHLTKLSFSFYDRVQIGQLISRANSDIRAVQMFLQMAPSLAVQMFGAVFAFAVMLTINVPLAFVAMGVMPLIWRSGTWQRKKMFPISWVVQARLAEVSTLVEENVSGVRIVKSFAAERQQLGALAKIARRVQWATVRQVDINARWTPILQNLPGIGLAFVLLYGGYLVIHKEISLGAILAFNTYVLMLQAPFRMLGMILMMGQRAEASAQRIYEILDEAPEIVDRPGSIDLVDAKGDVEFRNVSFSYGNGPRVLDGLDLRIRPGETVALVGRAGTGKSTIARLVPRFYDVSGGGVYVDGHDVRDLTLASLRSHIGLVLDEPFLFSTSVRDNIAYGRPDAPFEEVVAAAKAAQAHDFIMELSDGYDTIVGERGYTLSGGQRQRIAIARTLLGDPRILILDDATSAIDVKVELEIHEALRQLLGKRTTLLVAHRLSTISLADRVALIEDGKVVAEGTHAELLLSEPRYAEVLANVEEEEEAKAAAASAAGKAEEGWRAAGGTGAPEPPLGDPGAPLGGGD